MEQFSGTTWRTSSYSGSQGDCVEFRHTTDAVGVRDTKNRMAGHLVLRDDIWTTFVTQLRDH